MGEMTQGEDEKKKVYRRLLKISILRGKEKDTEERDQ